MAKIVAIHGIFHKYEGPNVVYQEWFPALKDGLVFADGPELAPDDLAIAFYGDIFRKRMTKGISEPVYGANDVTDLDERMLLTAWSQEARRIERELEREVKAIRVPGSLQLALLSLCKCSFFAGIAETVIIARLKEVSRYLHDEAIFGAVQAKVEQTVTRDTKVLIGHSLGSVVAYEALCAHPEWAIDTLITLGSPLGIPSLFFERLRRPSGYQGVWPGKVKRWTNIADSGDIVALKKQLKPIFGNTIEDILLYNGVSAHTVTRYLTAEESGRAIKEGLEC